MPGVRHQIWATQPYCDGNTYAALLNMGDSNGTFALDFSLLPSRSSATKAVVRDLWAHQDLGTFIGTGHGRGASSERSCVWMLLAVVVGSLHLRNVLRGL